MSNFLAQYLVDFATFLPSEEKVKDVIANASRLTTGLVNPLRLGPDPSPTKVLFGNNTWGDISSALPPDVVLESELAPIAFSGSASDLTTGTVPLLRLPSEVARKDLSNVFAQGNTFQATQVFEASICVGLGGTGPRIRQGTGQVFRLNNNADTARADLEVGNVLSTGTVQVGGTSGHLLKRSVDELQVRDSTDTAWRDIQARVARFNSAGGQTLVINGSDIAGGGSYMYLTSGSSHLYLRTGAATHQPLTLVNSTCQFAPNVWHGDSVNLERILFSGNGSNFYKGWGVLPHRWRNSSDTEIMSLTDTGNLLALGTIQLGGTSGPILKNSSGILQIRNSSDSAFGNIQFKESFCQDLMNIQNATLGNTHWFQFGTTNGTTATDALYLQSANTGAMWRFLRNGGFTLSTSGATFNMSTGSNTFTTFMGGVGNYEGYQHFQTNGVTNFWVHSTGTVSRGTVQLLGDDTALRPFDVATSYLRFYGVGKANTDLCSTTTLRLMTNGVARLTIDSAGVLYAQERLVTGSGVSSRDITNVILPLSSSIAYGGNGSLALYTSTSGDGTQIYLGDSNFRNSSYWNSAPGIGAVGAGPTSELAFYVYTGSINSRAEAGRFDASRNLTVQGNINGNARLNIVGPSTGNTLQATYTNTTSGQPAGFRLSNGGWDIGFRTNPNNGWFEITDSSGGIQHRWNGKNYLMASDGRLYFSSETNFATTQLNAQDVSIGRASAGTIRIYNISGSDGNIQAGNATFSGNVTGTWTGNAVGILYGGTGATTAQGARTNLLPSQAGNSGRILTTNGTDVSWTAIGSGGIGDVIGPASSTDNAVVRFDGTTGKLVQNSATTIDDSGNITTDGKVKVGGATGMSIVDEVDAIAFVKNSPTWYGEVRAERYKLANYSHSVVADHNIMTGEWAGGYNLNILGRVTTGESSGVEYKQDGIKWYSEAYGVPGPLTPRMTLSPTTLAMNGAITSTGNLTVGTSTISSVAKVMSGATGTASFLSLFSASHLEGYIAQTATAMHIGVSGGLVTYSDTTAQSNTAITIGSTNNVTFTGKIQIGGSSGPTLKNSGGQFYVRNSADTTYVNTYTSGVRNDSGSLVLQAGPTWNDGSQIIFQNGPSIMGTMQATGIAFNIPLSVTGSITSTAVLQAGSRIYVGGSNPQISPISSDGSDNRILIIEGGGDYGPATRGPHISLHGLEASTRPGNIELWAGLNGDIRLGGEQGGGFVSGLTVKPNGRVQIGTSPANSYPLEVSGYAQSYVSSATATGWLSQNSLSQWGAQVSTAGDYEIMQYAPTVGMRRFWVSQAGEVYTQNQITTASTAANHSLNIRAITSQTGRLLRFADVNNAEVGFVGIDGSARFGGNVAIGSSPTAARVQIVAGGGPASVSEFFTSEANPRWAIGRDLILSGSPGIGFADPTATIAASGSAVGQQSTRRLSFYTSNGTSLVERAYIGSDGNAVFNGSVSVSNSLTATSRITANNANIGFQHFASTIYSHSNGILVATDIAVSDNAMFEFSIEGNSYNNAKAPTIARIQAYNYTVSGTLINTSAISTDPDLTFDLFHYNGFVYLWFAQSGSFQTYSIKLIAPSITRHITSISNLAKPTTGVTNSVTITPNKIWTQSNDGASSGLDADLLDGQHGSYYATASSISGTINYIPKFTSSSAIGNSQIFDNGTWVGIGTTSTTAGYRLSVNGSATFSTYAEASGMRVQSPGSGPDVLMGTGRIAIGGSLGEASFQDRDAAANTDRSIIYSQTGDLRFYRTDDIMLLNSSRVRSNKPLDIHQIDGLSNYTRIARTSDGRLTIYRPNDTSTPAVSFGSGNDELHIRSGLGVISHSGANFAISATSTSTLSLASASSNVIISAGGASPTVSITTGVLEAHSDIRIDTDNDLMFNRSGQTTASTGRIKWWTSAQFGTSLGPDGTDFTIQNWSNTALRINNSGNTTISNLVGIGTSPVTDIRLSLTPSTGSSNRVTTRVYDYGSTHDNNASCFDIAYLGGTISSPTVPVAGVYRNILSFRTGGTTATLSIPSFSIRATIGSIIGSSMSEVITSFMTTSTATGLTIPRITMNSNLLVVDFPQGSVQLGTNTILKNDSGALHVRNSSDNAFANMVLNQLTTGNGSVIGGTGVNNALFGNRLYIQAADGSLHGDATMTNSTTGAVFKWGVSTTHGGVSLESVQASQARIGYIGWFKPTGTRQGYMGYDSGNDITLTIESGGNFAVTTGIKVGGIGGPLIKNSSETFQFRNSADSAFANIEANNIVVNGTLSVASTFTATSGLRVPNGQYVQFADNTGTYANMGMTRLSSGAIRITAPSTTVDFLDGVTNFTSMIRIGSANLIRYNTGNTATEFRTTDNSQFSPVVTGHLSVVEALGGSNATPANTRLRLMTQINAYMAGAISGRTYSANAAHGDIVLSANPLITTLDYSNLTDDLVVRGNTGHVEINRGRLILNDIANASSWSLKTQYSDSVGQLDFINHSSVSRISVRQDGQTFITGSNAGATFQGLTVQNIAANASGLKTRIRLPVFNGSEGGVIEEIGNSIDGYRLNIYSGQASGVLTFGTGGDNERMRIDSSGNIIVGTGTAYGKLNIYGGATYIIQDQPVIWHSAGTIRSQIIGDSTNNLRFSTRVGGVLTENFVVSTLGFVGVGTPDPLAKFHVRRTSGTHIRIGVSDANADTVQGGIDWFSNDAGTPDFFGSLRMRFQGGTGVANRQMQFLVADSATPKMTLDGNGNLTITGTIQVGTSGPILKNNSGLLQVRNSTDTGFASVSALIGSFTNTAIPLYAIRTGGTGTDNTTLQIGDGTIAGSIFFMRSGGGGNASVGYKETNSTGHFTITSAGGGGFITLDTGAGEAMRVVPARRVLIGTTTDDTTNLLQVAGSTTMTGNLTVGGTFNVTGSITNTYTKTHNLTRTLPATVGDYVDIGTFSFTNGAGLLDIAINVGISANSQAKFYKIPCYYSSTSNNWRKIPSLSASPSYATNDFDLEIRGNAGNTELRIRKTSGTVGGTIQIAITQYGRVDLDTFTASTATGSGGAPTALAAEYHTENLVIRAIGGSTEDLLIARNNVGTNVARITHAGQFVMANGVNHTSLTDSLTRMVFNTSGTTILRGHGTEIFAVQNNAGSNMLLLGSTGNLTANGNISAGGTSTNCFMFGNLPYFRVAQLVGSNGIVGGYNIEFNGTNVVRNASGSVSGYMYQSNTVNFYAEPSAAPATITPKMTLSDTLLLVNENVRIGDASSNFSTLTIGKSGSHSTLLSNGDVDNNFVIQQASTSTGSMFLDVGTGGLRVRPTGTSTDIFRILNSGNTGIGVNPTARFHVVEGANTFKFNSGASSVTPNISIGTSGGKSVALSTGTSGSSFTFDNTGFFAITSDSKANIDGGSSGGGTILLRIENNGSVRFLKGVDHQDSDGLLRFKFNNASSTAFRGYSSNPFSFINAAGSEIVSINQNGVITAGSPFADSKNGTVATTLYAQNLFNNMGLAHASVTDFNSVNDYGFRYVQGNTNGPGTGSSQFYNISLGLGIDYTYSQYAIQLAIPRYNSSDKYISMRTREAGTWGSWQKIAAGTADGLREFTWSGKPAATSTKGPIMITDTVPANTIWTSDGSVWRSQTRTRKVITFATTMTLDSSEAMVQRITATNNFTLNKFTNGFDGASLEVIIRQDGTGGRTLTFGTGFRFNEYITSITLSTGANKTDRILFEYDATDDVWDVISFVKGS